MIKALQCRYSYLHLMLHVNLAVREGIACSICPLIQEGS